MNQQQSFVSIFQQLAYGQADRLYPAALKFTFRMRDFNVLIQLYVEQLHLMSFYKYSELHVNQQTMSLKIVRINDCDSDCQLKCVSSNQISFNSQKDFLGFLHVYQNVKSMMVCSELYDDIIKNIDNDQNLDYMLEYFMEDLQNKGCEIALRYLVEKLLFSINIKIVLLLFREKLEKFTQKILFQDGQSYLLQNQSLNLSTFTIFKSQPVLSMAKLIGKLHLLFDHILNIEIKIFLRQKFIRKLIMQFFENILRDSKSELSDFSTQCLKNNQEAMICLSQLLKYCKIYEISEEIVYKFCKSVQIEAIIKKHCLISFQQYKENHQFKLQVLAQIIHFYFFRFPFEASYLIFNDEVIDFFRKNLFEVESSCRLILQSTLEKIMRYLAENMKFDKTNELIYVVMTQLEIDNSLRKQKIALKFLSNYIGMINIETLLYELRFLTCLDTIIKNKIMLISAIKILTHILNKEDSMKKLAGYLITVLKYYVQSKKKKSTGILEQHYKYFFELFNRKGLAEGNRQCYDHIIEVIIDQADVKDLNQETEATSSKYSQDEIIFE